MTPVTDVTQRQLTTFTPVSSTTNGALTCANYRLLNETSSTFNNLKWGNSVTFRAGYKFWTSATSTTQTGST